MRKLLHCFALITLFKSAAAQCPAIANCPQGSPVVCDISDNDPQLWNEPPFTRSTALDSDDLYEGMADFSIKIVRCLDNSLQVSYVLFLDLDNDNLAETAVSSAAFPPPGLVFANNAFTPGYAGGDPVVFDKRPVPDSLKFCFALETNALWDTVTAHLRWKTGTSFVSPRLPEGKHRLVWRVEQGGTVKYCEHSFRIKDCLPPSVICAAGLHADMNPNRTLTLSCEDILETLGDNATPNDLILLSLRKAGTDTGFPLDEQGHPVDTLTFDCTEIGDQALELWAKDRLNNNASCTTTVTIADGGAFCTIFPRICARPFWADSGRIQQVAFRMVWVDTAQQLVTLALPGQPDACAELNYLPPAGFFSLVPEKDINPLNGVSTFDLVLIAKHIIGLQPFDAPWKWIAADANRNGSVTSFDVVEIRKLILGLYNKFPSNTSWQFFTADCAFPEINPLNAYCPSQYTYSIIPLWEYPQEIVFNGVKTGDVNGSAKPGSFSADAPLSRGGEPLSIVWPDLALPAGESLDIPLCAAEAGLWTGFQLGLKYNANLIDIEIIKPGLLPDLGASSFALPAPGILNVSWSDARPQAVLPGDSLLILRIKARQRAALRDVMALSGERIRPEIYTAGDIIHSLEMQFTQPAVPTKGTVVFPPQPNPTTAGANIPLRLEQPETARLELFDIPGNLLWHNDIQLEKGGSLPEIPASAFPRSGIFVWRIRAGEITRTGKIVRY